MVTAVIRLALGLAKGATGLSNRNRRYQNAFNKLLDNVRLAHSIISSVVERNGGMSSDLSDALRQLDRKLHEINYFVQKEAKKGLVIRIIMYEMVLVTIKELQENLKQSLDTFMLLSILSFQQNVADMQTRNDGETLLPRTRSGGTDMPIGEFGKQYFVNKNVVDKLSGLGYDTAGSLRFATIQNLREDGFEWGEVNLLKDAVDKWAPK